MRIENTNNHPCCKCGESADYIWVIDDRGYGSAFDNMSEPTTIPVCEKCGEEHLEEEWFTTASVIINRFQEVWPNEQCLVDFVLGLEESTKEKVLCGLYN